MNERGFTMMEMTVTAAILGILAGMTVVGLNKIRPRSELATAAAEITAALNSARTRAIATGSDVWFGWRPVPAKGASAKDGFQFVVYEDWNGNFDPDTFRFDRVLQQVDREAAGQGRRQDEVVDHQELHYSVVPAAGTDWGTSDKIPEPFRRGFVLDKAYNGCSFCPTDGRAGWIKFMPRGELEFKVPAGTPQPPGGVIVVGSQDATDGHVVDARLISITAPFGLVRSFQQ